jgi:hypothetical protein
MRDVSVVSSSLRFRAASGGNAFSQEQKCSAKSGAFNSVVDAFVLLRMVGYLANKVGKSVLEALGLGGLVALFASLFGGSSR